MSVTLLLIPVALAAAAVAGTTGAAGALSMLGGEQAASHGGPGGRAGESDGARPVTVQTRMKDRGLLADALRTLGASELSDTGDEVAAVVGGLAVRLSRTPEEIWQLHLERVDGHELSTAEATSFAQSLDVAYAAEVQRAVAARIRERADAAGFELTSETRDEDDTLTMVLTVKDYA